LSVRTYSSKGRFGGLFIGLPDRYGPTIPPHGRHQDDKDATGDRKKENRHGWIDFEDEYALKAWCSKWRAELSSHRAA